MKFHESGASADVVEIRNMNRIYWKIAHPITILTSLINKLIARQCKMFPCRLRLFFCPTPHPYKLQITIYCKDKKYSTIKN